MGFLDKMFGGALSQKTPEQTERDRLAEEAIADAKERGMDVSGEVLKFKGSADEPTGKKTSYTGQQREDDRAA